MKDAELCERSNKIKEEVIGMTISEMNIVFAAIIMVISEGSKVSENEILLGIADNIRILKFH